MRTYGEVGVEGGKEEFGYFGEKRKKFVPNEKSVHVCEWGGCAGRGEDECMRGEIANKYQCNGRNIQLAKV